MIRVKWLGKKNLSGPEYLWVQTLRLGALSFFHVPLFRTVFQRENSSGERADLTWAAPEPVEDLPALQDREAALGVGADRGVAAVGFPGRVRQVPPLVRGEQSKPVTTDVALVGVEVEFGAVSDIEHVVGAGGGEVVGGAGQPVRDPDQPSVRVGQPLQVHPVVAVPAGVVP